MATLYVFESAEKAAAAGYTGTYYTTIIDAVQAASATEKTTIIVGDGTYSGDVAFIKTNITAAQQESSGVSLDDSEIVGEQKGDIVIKAAEGAENVTFTGTFLMGFRIQGQPGEQKWNADVEFQGITFDHAESEKHSIVAQNSSNLTFTDCTIIGDGEYGIGSNGQNGCDDVTFTECTVENAGIQAYGGFLSDLKFDNCIFNDSRVNMASNGNATFSDCEFNVTLTESNTTEIKNDETVSANFYVLRVPSNGGLTVNIENGCEFNVDSTLSATAAPAADKYWTIFANRNTGSAVSWNIADAEVNFTDAAMNNKNIKLSAIDPTKAASIKDTNTTITNMTSTSNDVGDLIAKTSGAVKVQEGDIYVSYKDGEMNMPAFDGVDNLIICNLDDLKTFRDMVNAGNTFAGKTITLAADIDLAGEAWEPIGTATYKFLGNFDGGNHTVKNLVVDGDIYWGSGFFGNVENGNPEIAHNVIKNLTIENASVSGTNSVGVIAGAAYCTDISNVTVKGNVSVNGQWYVGAAFGRLEYGNLNGCVIDADSGKVYSKDSNYIGGVIGFTAEGSLKYNDISSNINVEAEGDCDYVGGIFGIIHYNNKVDDIVCNADSITCDNATVGAIAGTWGNAAGTTVVVKNATVGEDTKVMVKGKEVESSLMGVPRHEETDNSGALAVVDTNEAGEVTKIVEVSGPKGMETALSSGTSTINVYIKDAKGEYSTFADYASAVAAAAPGAEIIVSGNLQGTVQVIKNDVLVDSGASVSGKVIVGDSGLGYGETIQDNGTQSAELEVKGTVNASNTTYLWVGNAYGSDFGTNTRFTLNVNGGTVNDKTDTGLNLRSEGAVVVQNGGKYNTSGIVTEGGSILVTGKGSILDTKTEAGSVNLMAGSVTVENDGIFQLSGTQVNHQLIIGKGVEFAIKSNGTLNLTTSKNSITNNGTLSITGGTLRAANNTLTNNDTVNISGGTVDVGTLTNNGTFKVTGADASTVNAKITGNAVEIADATIADSKINAFDPATNRTSSVVGVVGNTVFDGENQIGKMWIAGDTGNIKVTINETSSLQHCYLVIGACDKLTSGMAWAYGDYAGKNGAELIVNGNASAFGDGTTELYKNGTLTVNGEFSAACLFANDATSVININEKGKISGVTYTTVSGTMNVTGGTYDNSGISPDLYGYGVLSIASGAELKIDNYGTVNLVTKLNNDGEINITASGIGEVAAITASSITGNGTITVNAKGWSGIAKVVDLTTGENAVDVEITGNSKAYQVTNGNDTYVTTADKASFLLTADVNGDGEADKFGDVSADGNFIAGVNAFDSAADAISAMTDATKTIYVNGEVNGSSWINTDRTGKTIFANALNFQAFDAEKGATLKLEKITDNNKWSAYFTKDLTIGKGVTLEMNTAGPYEYDNSLRFVPADKKLTITVDGTFIYSSGDFGVAKLGEDGLPIIENDQYIAGEDGKVALEKDKFVEVIVSEDGKMINYGESNNTFFANSSLTVTGKGTADKKMEEVQFKGGTFTSFAGKVTFKNTNVEITGMSSYIVDNFTGLMPTETFTGSEVFTAENTVINVIGYKDASDESYVNAIAFNKTSNLKNTDITAGDFFVNGKTITMNGGSLTLKSGTADSTYGPEYDYKSSGDLTIAEDATLAMTNAALNAEGTVTNKGTLTVNGGTFTADSFKQNSSEQAIFNNVVMDVNSLNTGGNAWVVVGGKSQVKIDNLSGSNALRLAAGTTLRDGTSIEGSGSARALGSVTFGKNATDKVYICSFDNKGINWSASSTITVNGTLDVSADGKGYPVYWFGIYGGKLGTGAVTTLTGTGTVNVNTTAIFQLGTVVIDKGLTINVTNVKNTHLRFTEADVTIKGIVSKDGYGDVKNLITNATVTVTGKDASLSIADDFRVGYSLNNSGVLINEDSNMQSSILNIKDGAVVNVGKGVYVNVGTGVNVNNATFIAGTMNNNGEFNVSGKSTIDIDQINGGVRMNGFTGSFDANVKGYVLTYGKSEFSNDFDTQDLYVGKKIENGAKANTDILTVKSGVTLDTAVIYVRGTGVMNIEAGAAVNTSMHFNGSESGGFYSYGTTNISGSLTINGGDGMLIGSSSYANENGVAVINVKQGGTLSISNVTMKIDSDAALNITSGTFTAGSVTNNGTITISGNSTINATITGNVAKVSKGAVLTVVDSAFADGVDSYTMMLDVYSLANLKSINGVDVVGNATAGYSVKIGEVLYTVTDANAGGLVFTALKDNEGNISDDIEIDDYTGSLDGLTSVYAVEAKAGTATLKVNKGQSATVAAITKDENGGVTNLNLNGNLTVGTTDNHGSIEAVGKITTGSDVEVKMGDVSGTNLNSTISLGKNNDAFFDNIDMKGGSNTLSIGANSDVEVDDIDNTAAGYIKNVKTINLASGTAANAKKGTEADYTTLTVTGDITAPAMSNSITLGNYAQLFVDGNLDNSDVNVGTTIKAGNYSEVIFGKPDVNGNITGGKVTSLAGLTLGTEGVFKAAVVGGTAGNNTISLGKEAEMYVVGGINLLLGNDTIKTGTGAKIEVGGDVKGVETISLGKGAVMIVGKVDDATDTITTTDVIGLAGLTLASGSAAKFDKNGNEIAEEVNTIFAAGDVYGTEKNNTINVGNFGIFTADSIDMLDGNDTIKIGSDSEFVVATFDQQGNKDHADIANVETISIGARSTFAAEDIIGVNKLTAANGSYDKKTDKAIYTILGTEGFIEGTAKNDTISLGNWNYAMINGGIDLLDGNDTIKIGNDSVLLVGKDQQGAGNLDTADIANVETISIGARSLVAAENITGVNKLTAANGVSGATTQILATGKVTGTAKNDTIALGNWNAAQVGEIDLGAGNDTLKLGNDSLLAVADVAASSYADIKNVETISIGARSTFAAKDITGVNKLTAANGTYTKKTDETVWTVVKAGNVTGTDKNDTVSFGNYNDIELASLNLGAGNDTVKIGTGSMVDLGVVDFGDGKDTMTIGKDAVVKLATDGTLADLETLNATKGSELWVDNGVADVVLDKGSWQNATIFDMQGTLPVNGEISGSTYKNEWDFYTFDVTGTDNDDVIVSGADAKDIVDLYKFEEGKWVNLGSIHPVDDIGINDVTGITGLAEGKYAVAVNVSGSGLKKDDTPDYSFGITLA